MTWLHDHLAKVAVLAFAALLELAILVYRSGA